MKRSEMIELLYKSMKDYGFCTTDGIDTYQLHDFDVEVILDFLEKTGMLPPPDKAEAVTGRIVYAYYYNEQVEELPDNKYESLVDRNKLWDKEDEA